jgi:hypothetical protein
MMRYLVAITFIVNPEGDFEYYLCTVVEINYFSAPHCETTPYFDNRVSKRTESGIWRTALHYRLRY